MRSHDRTPAWLVLLAALFVPATAGAIHGFEQASFTGPVVADEPATLVIGRCTHFALPACGCWYWSSLLVVDWGDGESDSEYRSSGKPRTDTDRPAGGEFEIQHTYGAPGTYWVKIAFDGGCTAIPPCEHTGGRCVQWLKADVQPSPSAPLGAWVGIFLDAQASTCGGQPAPATRLYVLGGIEGDGEVSGGEFRIATSGRGPWFISESAAPGSIKIGQVLGDGASIGGACGDPAVLVTLDFWPLDPDAEILFTVAPHRNPSNPGSTQPMLIRCDPPFYTATPIHGRYAALLSPTLAGNASCYGPTVAVRQTSWSRIKNLYRDTTSFDGSRR